ncbi:MAG: CDGSH iron-sulfur domain-containing protein [Tepidisphaerales bacterium]
MPRLVRHDATGPVEVKPQEKSIWVCACGLSQNLPHCDGSHKKTRSEQPGQLAVYDKARTTVVRTTPDE